MLLILQQKLYIIEKTETKMTGYLKEMKIHNKSVIFKYNPRKCWMEVLLKDEYSLGRFVYSPDDSSLEAAANTVNLTSHLEVFKTLVIVSGYPSTS